MSKQMQRIDMHHNAARKTGVAMRNVVLSADSALLVLVLVIIPTISGVTLIA